MTFSQTINDKYQFFFPVSTMLLWNCRKSVFFVGFVWIHLDTDRLHQMNWKTANTRSTIYMDNLSKYKFICLMFIVKC